MHTIYVAFELVTTQGLLSKKTVKLAVGSKFTPVRVTVSPPRTEPNLGLMLERVGVADAWYVTTPEDCWFPPTVIVGTQVCDGYKSSIV